jgi:hypothetical protein
MQNKFKMLLMICVINCQFAQWETSRGLEHTVIAHEFNYIIEY